MNGAADRRDEPEYGTIHREYFRSVLCAYNACVKCNLLAFRRNISMFALLKLIWAIEMANCVIRILYLIISLNLHTFE